MGDLAKSWRAANEKLRHLADCITAAAGQPANVALGYLVVLGEELTNTRTLLEETQASGTRDALDKHLAQYRDYLKLLSELLPKLQAQLLAERSRLKPEREHLQAAAAWAQCAKALLK